MASRLQTPIIAAVVVGLAAYAYFVEHKGAEKEKLKKEDEERIVRIESSKITGLEIIKDDKKVKIEKVDGKWKIAEPLSDLADGGTVDSFVSTLTSEKSRERVAEGATIDWKNFGLDKPAGTLTVFEGDKKSVFSVGSVKAYDSSSYLKIGDEAKVLLASSAWDSHVSKKAPEFRDKRLLRNEAAVAYDSLELIVSEKGKTTKIELQRQDGVWRPKGAKDTFPIAADKVVAYVDSVKNLKATDFIEADAKSAKELAAKGLDKPEVILRLKEGSNAPFELKISAPAKGAETNVHVLGSHVEAIASVYKTSTDGLKKILGDFYDKKLPFQFEPEQASRALIEIGQVVHEIEKKDGKWSVKRSTADGQTLDTEKAKDLVSRVSKLEATEILEPVKKESTPFKVAGAAEFQNEKGETMLKIRWADMTDKKVKLVSNKTERLVTVAEPTWSALPFKQLFVPKALPSPTSAASGEPGKKETK